MAGHIRQLKPDFFLDEEFWALQVQHLELHLRQAFEGLWCHSDREGRFEWRPMKLKSQILPYWSGDFAVVLEALMSAGYVVRYESGGRVYGACRSFSHHQRPGNKEPASVIPDPPLLAEAGSSQLKSGKATRVTQSLPQSQSITPIPIQGGAGGVPNVPGLVTITTPAGVVRVVKMPSCDPPREYLDEGVIRGIPLEQVRSTWEWYSTKGLPSDGVDNLHGWLLQQAKERWNRQQRASRTVTADDKLQRQADRVSMLRAQEAAEEARQKAAQ